VNLKIGHFHLISANTPGVIKKINAQAKVWIKIYSNIEIVIFTDNIKSINIEFSKNLKLVQLPNFFPKTSIFKTPYFISEFANQHNFDVIIGRFNGLSPLFKRAFKNKKFTLITEYHTLIEAEFYSSKRPELAFLYKFSKKISDIAIDGKICVTNEIANSETFNKPIKVISNGFESHNNETPSFKIFDNRNINLLISCSEYRSWHGIERLFNSVLSWKKTNPELQISIDIVGDIKKEDFNSHLIPENVEFHGLKSNDEVFKLAKNSNFGISTLSLYKKQMSEACPLKSREYISIGLPFIYAYDDVDIPLNNIFAMKIPNDNTLIDISSVLEWLNYIKRDSIKFKLDWHLLKKNISWDEKLKNYLVFINEIRSLK